MRNSVTPKPWDRAIATLWIVLISTLGCPGGGAKLAPAPGLPQYQERAMIPVPGAAVNAMGGNLLVRRAALDIDTHLGNREIGATYNSASGKWLWSFDISYDGATFVDPTGASHDSSALAPGDAIPGTVWVVVDSDTIKTKGGLAHDFAPDSRLAAVHYTSAEYPRLTYRSELIAGEPRTVAVDQCMAPGDCDPVFAISYGAEGRVASITDRAGRVAEVEHSDDRLVRLRDGLDTARGWPGTRYEYADARLTAIVTSEGERVEYGYSGRRVREVRAIGEENPVHRFDYYVKNDAGLYATRYMDPLGNLFWLRYDSQRRLHEFEAVDVEEMLRFTWDGSRVAAEIQPSGATTRWTHQGDDVAVEVQPSGNVVLRSYAADAVNRDAPLERAPLEVVDGIGLRERRSYDASGRLVAIENGEGEGVASYSYASDQTVAYVTSADGVVGYADYGAHGHPTRITSARVEITNEYDAVGNLRRGWNGVAPELGGIVYREYDEDRNLRRIAVADAGVGGIQLSPDRFVEIDYRSDGRRTRIARPGGGDHEFVYDALGRLTRIRERVDGVWRATTYEYDAAGRSTATERPNGMRRETEHDALGRPVSIRNLRGGVVESTATLSYAGGQLRSVEDSVRGGVESYWYDGAGRVEAIAYPEGEVLVREYDLRSRKIREGFATDSMLRWIDRGYDLADREVGVWDSGEALLQHRYEGGKRVETSYGNGLTRTYRYDSESGELEGSRTEGPAGVVEKTWITRERLASFVPGLRVTAVTKSCRGVVATTTEDYLLGPTAGASGQEPAVGKRVYMWSDGNGGSLYEYDALSNARGSQVTGESFEYNAEGNRLLSATTNAAGTIDYSYDEAGFATSRGGVPLAWTASGRLASFGADVTLEWDALDRRVRSTVMGAESRWRFGGRVQASPEGLPASVDLGEVRVDLAGGRHLYRHHDFRGNVKLVSDQDGEIRSHYHYDAYGLRKVRGADDDSIRFAGRSQIGELVAMDARIYDPAVGRFLSPDPVLQHVNQYAYALGNPVWFTDSSGRDAESMIEGAAATIALGTAMAALFFVASVVTALLAVTSLTVAALGFGFFVARQGTRSRRGRSGVVSGPSSGVTPGRAGRVGGSDGSCSPVRLASVPGLGRLHWALIAAQILLAPLLIRSWGGRRRRRPR